MIVVLGAVPSETAPLLKIMKDTNSGHLAGYDYYRGTLGNREVLVATSGIGKVSAAALTQAVVLTFSVRYLMFVGLAGSLSPEVEVGDLVLATETLQHDVSRAAGGYILEPPLVSMASLIYRCHEEFLEAALTAGKSIAWQSYPWSPGRLPVVHSGRILTGDRVIAREETARKLMERFAGLAVEMEGAAAAQVCAQNGIPFLLLRAISDRADGLSAETFQQTQAAVSYNICLFVREITNNLSIKKM